MFGLKRKTFIVSDLELRGHLDKEQQNGDCARRIIQFYTDNGELVLEYDPWKKTTTVFREDLLL